MTTQFDILGIGNAIVDVLARVSPAFLSEWDMLPGAMALIDADRADSLTVALEGQGEITLRGGGSVANSCVAAAQLGARVGYLGKVADDALGHAFRADMAECGIEFPPPPLASGPATARCLIVVTPDGQRTMNTFLGAANRFGPEDVDPALIAASRFVFLEGYLFDPPHAQLAFRHAASSAHDAGRLVAISLSDPFCVDRHRDAFRAFVRDHADIVFANEHELESLYQTSFDAALDLLASEVEIGIGTRSAAGSTIVARGARHAVQAVPTEVIDTTGAGDAYAAGVLAGLARDLPFEAAGALGSLAAAEIVSHVGARPEADLAALARAHGLL